MAEPERRFSFRGRGISAREGETALSALSHDGVPLLRRSIRYHRPQGAFCGIGHCAGCLVRVNGRPNVRACRYEPAAGDAVTTENAWPSPTWDALGAIGFFAPGGIDTLHGLRRPALATPLYQRFVRWLSGTGDPPDEAVSRSLTAPAIERSAEVVVIGAGAAGRAVAGSLVARGMRPVVIERALRPPPLAGAEVLPATTAVFLPPPQDDEGRHFTLLAFREPAQGARFETESVVVATGGYDTTLIFGGNDRPGVMSADAALSLSVPPFGPRFRRAVLVGGGHRSAEVLARCGDAVEAVVAPGEIRPEVVRAAADLGIPLFPRSLLLRAEGRSRVRAVRIRARGGGAHTRISCDAVVLAHRRVPHVQLFFQAGATMEWNSSVGAYFPVLRENGATSVAGLFAAGSAAVGEPTEFPHPADALAEAVVRGESAPESPVRRPPETPPTELLGYYRELLRERGHGRWVACPCEDVLLAEVEEAVRRGYRGIEVVKRYSSLGTGICQGRYCLPDALLLLSLLEDRTPSEVGYITQRPPVVPTPLAALAALPPSANPEPVA